MHIFEIFKPSEMTREVEDRYIRVQKHPTLPLDIWTYTHQAQFDNHWTDATKFCRGVITDNQGNFVSRPFGKFFNYSEHVEKEELPNPPDEDFVVYEKLDGFLGISYYWEGEWAIASKGSFDSDHAKTANRLLRTIYSEMIPLMNPKYTYVFEVISPLHQIVVNYGDVEEMYLLAVFESQTGREVSIDHPDISLLFGNEFRAFSLPARYQGMSIQAMINFCKKQEDASAEGFVIQYKSGLRMKMKGEEYLRIHRLVTNFTPKHIWEILKKGGSLIDYLDRVPDEFYDWARKVERSLRDEFHSIEDEADNAYNEAMNRVALNFGGSLDYPIEGDQRKEFAREVYTYRPLIRSLAFMRLDGKDWDEVIWKNLKPKGEDPFKQEE